MRFFTCVLLTALSCISGLHAAPKPVAFDYFIYAQEWPVAVCVTGKEEHHSCVIPPSLNSWNIHGLWPSNKDDKPVENCDSQNPLNITAIKPLLSQMNASWPNLYSDTSYTKFWEHEWSKHGTCALSNKETDSQFNYFNKVLQLNKIYNALNLLKEKGIIPSKVAKFKYSDIVGALKDVLTVEPIVEATKNHDTGNFMLFQIEICLDLSFVPIRCYHYPKPNFPTNDPLEYPTIHSSQVLPGDLDTLRYVPQI